MKAPHPVGGPSVREEGNDPATRRSPPRGRDVLIIAGGNEILSRTPDEVEGWMGELLG